MIQRISLLSLVLSALLLLSRCDISDNAIEPQLRFSKIYDNGLVGSDYEPLDVLQTPDGGYLMLAARDRSGIYLLRADSAGNFEWERPLDPDYVNAVPTLLSDGTAQYFFCMDAETSETQLMRVDDTGGRPEQVTTFQDIIFPLAASQTPAGQVLLMSYNPARRNTRLDLMNSAFVPIWDEEYGVFQDVQEDIVGHLSGIGPRLPFFTGTYSGGYYLNGLRNYSLAFMLVQSGNGEEIGYISGNRDGSGILAATALQGGDFAFARFSQGDSYLLPATSPALSDTAMTDDMGGFEMPELDHSMPVKAIELSDEAGDNTALFAGTSRAGSIVLYAYASGTNNLSGLRYLGAGQRYELHSMKATDDGGLVILAGTRVAGRYQRIALFKLSVEEVAALRGL